MKPSKTEIVCVVDRSGSMGLVREDAIGSFNSFLEEQKKVPGECLLSLTLFNTEYEIRHNGLKLADVPALTEDTYVPCGCTALFDAAAKTIDEVGERLKKTSEAERPERVLFVILTDGQENSSKEYTREQVMSRIKEQTDKWKWEFVFLAAGKDAFATGQSIGIKAGNISAYAAGDPKAHASALRAFSSNTARYRGGHDVDWQSKA